MFVFITYATCWLHLQRDLRPGECLGLLRLRLWHIRPPEQCACVYSVRSWSTALKHAQRAHADTHTQLLATGRAAKSMRSDSCATCLPGSYAAVDKRSCQECEAVCGARRVLFCFVFFLSFLRTQIRVSCLFVCLIYLLQSVFVCFIETTTTGQLGIGVVVWVGRMQRLLKGQIR